mmetsp:Transcript_20341/g.78145  ORF Transcript_20341/g.78145 Transcript_20341/m.78145 type:complete len:255 (-) Transcript_20341:35-799(-)
MPLPLQGRWQLQQPPARCSAPDPRTARRQQTAEASPTRGWSALRATATCGTRSGAAGWCACLRARPPRPGGAPSGPACRHGGCRRRRARRRTGCRPHPLREARLFLNRWREQWSWRRAGSSPPGGATHPAPKPSRQGLQCSSAPSRAFSVRSCAFSGGQAPQRRCRWAPAWAMPGPRSRQRCSCAGRWRVTGRLVCSRPPVRPRRLATRKGGAIRLRAKALADVRALLERGFGRAPVDVPHACVKRASLQTGVP